jgi:sec-independent protein translocase protein TatC
MALVPFPGPAAPEPPEQSDVTPYTVNSPPPASPPARSAPPDDGEPEEEEPIEGRMTFLEHLDELRKRITHSVVALFVGFVVAFGFIERVKDFIFARLTADIPGGVLIYTEPGEAFFLYIKMAAIAGVLLSSPYVMYQVWLFIAPGLYANEKRLAVPFVFFATLLFISGAAFSHYLLFPAAWAFFASFSDASLEFTPRIQPVWSLYVKLLLAMGVVFQLPMLMFVLARFGAVTARFLISNFKYAILIFFVVAAIITPDGSMVPQVIMAGSMVVLYIVSIGVVWVFGKKTRTAEAE